MRFVVVLASYAAVLGLATPAQADPGTSGPDASFLAALNEAGITFQDPIVAVAVAKMACALMDQGNTQTGVIKSVSSSNPGFSPDGAAKFTMIAASAYCPQHMGQPIAPVHRLNSRSSTFPSRRELGRHSQQRVTYSYGGSSP